MLPKKNRLKKRRDFEKVFKQGKGYKEDFLFLKVVQNNLTISRFGFIVGKKFSKKTTVRNKTKRQLREILKQKLKRIKKGVDGVLMAYPGLETKSFLEINKMVENVLKKAGVINHKT